MTHQPVLPFIAAAVVGALALGACAAPAQEPARASLAGAETSTGRGSVADGDAQIDPEPSAGQTPDGGEPWDAAVSRICEVAVGAPFGEVAQSPHEAGTTSFWSSGRRWVLCDVVEGEPALVEGDATARRGFDEQTLGIRSVPPVDDAATSRFVAGGPLPWRVDSLGYTFPDGHVEQARFVHAGGEGWWAMSYTAQDGPLAEPGVDPSTLEPVTVSVVGGAAEAFRLPW